MHPWGKDIYKKSGHKVKIQPDWVEELKNLCWIQRKDLMKKDDDKQPKDHKNVEPENQYMRKKRQWVPNQDILNNGEDDLLALV